MTKKNEELAFWMDIVQFWIFLAVAVYFVTRLVAFADYFGWLADE